MYGEISGENACGNCVALNDTISSEIIPKAEIPVEYKHYSVYDDTIGKQVAESRNITDIPYVEHCKVAEDQTKKCDTVIGFKKEDWNSVGKKREEEF
jgi:hypothetical protein